MNVKVTACLAMICALLLLAIQANPVYDGELSQAERENLEALMDRANRRYLSRLVSGNYIKRGNAELVNGLLGMRYGDLMRAG
ncbi:hypothetical protein M514_05060 [Trichuris suis]|uniref:Uncharacterized protein n=1 Tax=Trichuris suis TaxID=68888 RepID=A0A085NCT7_9BILA|nr:hypothetical protein M513_05060 [Trichuris suis]KFD67283.1 hypothetical protein M514_05060 [Trichuris suis]KHJ47139.1 hypothetical protein D918_02700 [Trichuris suis]